MGTEVELKLHIDNAAQLHTVQSWEGFQTLREGPPVEVHMQTTYYDTPSRQFAARQWTVRQRLENENSVICVKAPMDDAASPLFRGEWEIQATSVAEGLPRLVAMGAPALLAELAQEGLEATCGAKFLRRAQGLRLPDGSLCELAADEGILMGNGATQPFWEIELELKSGSPEQMLALGRRLMAAFDLRPEPKSKFARARML